MARLRQTERERRRGDEIVETVASALVANRDLAGVQAVENFHMDVRNEHWRSRPGEVLDKGAALETGGEMKETALMEACYFGHADVVEALLKRGASVMARNAFGDSVMDVANKTKNSRIIELLKHRQ